MNCLKRQLIVECNNTIIILKERMERVEMLEKKVKDMERTCECSRFPKLFEECRKLRESSKDIDP